MTKKLKSNRCATNDTGREATVRRWMLDVSHANCNTNQDEKDATANVLINRVSFPWSDVEQDALIKTTNRDEMREYAACWWL